MSIRRRRPFTKEIIVLDAPPVVPDAPPVVPADTAAGAPLPSSYYLADKYM